MTETSTAGRPGPDELVEQMGIFYSSLGLPRATGQLFGYLVACDPPEQSAADIASATGMSRASVSSGAKSLLHLGAIEERHRVGDRKTYYRLRPGWWIRAATAKMAGFERVEDEARRIRAAGRVTRTDGLDELIEFSAFWNEEIPKLRERWERRQSERKEEA